MKNEFIAVNREFEQVKCQILATFYMDNKNYLFYKDNENNIYAGFVDNGDIKQILKPEEFKKVEKVYELLKGNEKKPHFIEFATQIYKGIPYKTIYDNIEDKCFTYKLTDGRFKEVEGEDAVYFDKLYNENIDKLYSGDAPKLGNNVLKKVVKIGNIFIIVLMLSEFAFTSYKTVDLNKGFVHNVTQIMEIYKVDEQDANYILSYINDNDRLSYEDKKFLTSRETFYKENEQYFHMPSVKKNLMNLEIIYDKGNHVKYNVPEKVRGFYQNYLDKIVVLYSDSVNDKDPMTEGVVFHEFMHAISNNGYISKGGLGVALTEGLTELMTEEYLYTSSDVYNKGQTYARLMCELIGADKVRESFFQGNLDMVIDELASITGTKDDATKFISLIDTEGQADTAILLNESPEAVSDAKMTLAKVEPVIDAYIKEYYEHKFNASVNDDLLMKAYYDSLRLTNTLGYSNFQEGNMKKINVVKNYFNGNLANDDVKVEYHYKNDVKKDINSFKVEVTKEGKFRRIFTNGKFIEYDENPNIVSYDKSSMTFSEGERRVRI